MYQLGTRRIHILAGLVLLALLLVACAGGPASPPPTFVPPTPKTQEIVQVVLRPSEEWLDARGYVSSAREEELYFPVGGYIKASALRQEERIRPGDHVQAGAVLAEIDAWELETSLGRARLELQIMELRHDAGARPSDLDEKIYQLQHAFQQDYVAGLQRRFDSTRLTAPFDGVLQSLTVVAGKSVQPYEVVGLLISPDELLVKALAPDAYRAKIMLGQPVSVTLNVSPNQSWPASVADISAATTSQAGGKYFEITVQFAAGADVPAAYKMACTARLLVDSGPPVLSLPARALIWEGSKAYVNVSAGARDRQEVTVGKRAGDWVEIVAGLSQGQSVYIPAD